MSLYRCRTAIGPQTFLATMLPKNCGQTAIPHFRDRWISRPGHLDSLAVFAPIGTRQCENLLSVFTIFVQNPP
jgi:hypothetical protein